MTAHLELDGIVKDYGSARAVDGSAVTPRDPDGPVRGVAGVSVTVKEGEFTCLLGPSGCGKTTLLRVIAGLEDPNAGRVTLAGRDITQAPAHARGVGYVFQEGVLFPHLTVAENVAFGLRVARWPQSRVAERVRELLALVGLEDHAGKRPDALSGGEQQRVALARALAPEPRVILMDEPLASLDRALREDLRREIRRLHDATGVTTVFVTHDTEEALALADTVHVMRAGRIVESGAPRDVYLEPRSAFAARFLGAANVVPGHVTGDGRVDTALGNGRPGAWHAPAGAREVNVLVRPQDLVIGGRDASGVPARVDEVRFLGRGQRVEATTKTGSSLFLDAPLDVRVAAGDAVTLTVDWARVRVVPRDD